MLKRWISLLLSTAMLLSMLPATALAMEPETLEGKTLSILGDSISTYTGVSNDKSVNATLAGSSVYYNGSTLSIRRADTWWQQTVDVLDMELLVNNSWSGSCIFPTRSGTAGAYQNRCVQLHNDKTGEEPDIIAVFLGTNDFYNFQSTLGTADIDYDALITENDDGTYTYAVPVTACEAYAIMLHKMTERYPEAEIYCMNMLPTRDPVVKGQNVGQPTDFNTNLAEIIEAFGCTLVDLEHCGIDKTGEVFDLYITDRYVHPGPKGMDKMTEALICAMTGEADATLCDISLNLNHVTADNEVHVSLVGEAYSNMLRINDGYENLKVTVTMGGEDITADCYADGKIDISAVTGDLVITASATIDKEPENYRWEFDGTDLVSATTGDNVQNALTRLAGTCESGALKNARYQLAREVVLSPDQPWVIEWEGSGAWNGLLLSSHSTSATKGMNYLYRSSVANRLVAFGEYTGSWYDNYGVTLADKVSAPDANHVYRVENRIAADGSNTAYLLVDGVELGAMDDYYIGGDSNQNKNVDWVDGKTFVFRYMGTSGHPLQNLNLKYLQVWEAGEPGSAGSDDPVDLFVFAGQSNMMGASILEPKEDTFTDKALEYKYMPKLRGTETGSFVPAQNPAGEFHYKDLTAAYGDKLGDLSYQSALTDYSTNTYFCPAMRNETKGFSAQSEADTYPGASLPPYFVTEYAEYGHSSVYAHMAKGGVKIAHYFTEEMMTRYNALITEYNAQNGSVYPTINHLSGAGDAFDNEYDAMLEDYANFAPDSDVENKCFVWLQGEGDAGGSYIEYKLKMQVLWEHLQELGFSHFFVLRVGYWGNSGIRNVIKAQEDFCAENDNCYIVTRAPSLIPYPGATTDNWWTSEPDAEYDDCRDSYVVNSSNHHFNEKAFQLFAERSAENIHRILYLDQEPILEQENIQGMQTEQPDGDEISYTSYVGAEVFRNSLSVSKISDTWEECAQSSAGSTDLIPVKSTDSVWLQYVFFKSEAHAVGGFYDADGNLVAPLYYKQFGLILDGNTGGVSAFQTPSATNRVPIAEVEAATGKEIAFVRFTAWKASAGGHANTEARIYHEAEEQPEEQTLSLRYDDHYDVTGKKVEIINAGTPTSYQVGYGVEENSIRDTAVVTLDGDTLVASGIGNAVVSINDKVYNITVETAPISLLLLIGQSNMEGNEGNAAQSIICPDGMVYGTYGDRYDMNISNATHYAPSALTGPYREINTVGGTDGLSDYPVYMLTERGAGRIGPDSGFAYEWVQQTGEKVWIVNAAHGGTSLNVWQPGTTQYEECEAMFGACQETLRKEIAAGHFTLSHMAYFWCQGCNDASVTAEWYVNKYLTMHEALKQELAFDHDSNPVTAEKTFEFGGIIPVRIGHDRYTSYREGVNQDTVTGSYYESFKDLRMSGPRVAQYWMGNNPDLEDIWTVCTIGEDWVWMPDGTNGVSDYFRKHYPNSTVDYTPQVAQSTSWYTPTTPKAVHDSIHYNQIGYNEVGRESVRNALIMMGINEDYDEETTVEFVNWTGYQPLREISASTTGRSGTLVVPMVSPITRCKNVTYTTSDGLDYKYYDLLAESGETTGTLTAVGANTASVNVVKQQPGELYTAHLSQLPEQLCRGVNLWSVLEHDPQFYYGGTHWGTHSSGTVYSVTIPVQSGDKLYATAWGKAGENGHAASNGIRVTFFDDYDVLKTMDPAGTYAEFSANGGYLMVPEGATAVNIPMWTNEDSNEIYILSRNHDESASICSICGQSSHTHAFSDWETVSLPTAAAQGVEQRTCACGESETRKVDGVWQQYALSDYLQALPANVCCDTNLWAELEHNKEYFANGVNWGVHSSGKVYSVTIPVTAGEKVYASSFGAGGTNGSSTNGIRCTFFDAYGIAKSVPPADVYAEFSANGYLTAPEGTVAVNIAMWTNADSWEIYLPDRDHQYTNGVCTGCGKKDPDWNKPAPNGWPMVNTDLTHIVAYGQSFSVGADAPIYPDPAVDGVYVFGSISDSRKGTQLTSIPTSGNQHPIISAGNILAQLLAEQGYDTDLVLGSYGTGGKTIAQLMSAERQAQIKSEEGYTYDCLSSGRYTVFEDSVDTLAAYAETAGQSISCPAIVYLQGETDQNTDEQLGYPENPQWAAYAAGGDKEKYKEYMTRLKDDMQAKVMDAYGQSEKPLFLIYQVSGTYTRTQYSSINMAQIEFAQENEDVILVQTPYFTPHYTSSHHLTQNGYRWLGEYIGRDIYTALVDREKPWPILPENIEIADANTVRITLSGAEGGLSIDTRTVENATNNQNLYGFYLEVDGINIVPTKVTTSGNNIELTLPAHTDLDIAKKVYLYYAGKNSRGTGNIRDNCSEQGFYSYLDDSSDTGTGNNQGVSHSALDADGNSIIGQKYPLYNWLASFCYEIPVTGEKQAAYYHWEMQETGLVSVTEGETVQNDLSLLQGSVEQGILKGVQYGIDKTIVLYHDQPWAIEWKAAGNGSSYGGGKLLCADKNIGSDVRYLYLPADARGFIAWGVSSESRNYGFKLSAYGIDTRVEHTYRIENRISADGANTVYLLVDGAEIGAMNTPYSTADGSKIEQVNNWANGKDIYLNYLGEPTSFLLNNMKLSYLKVWEGLEHNHSYEAVVTAPTCTEQGYTTYTCACGDSYVSDYVEAVWHSYANGQCSMCGTEMLRVSLDDFIRYQGGVNSTDGTLNTTFTNNWYADLRIPEGAEQVRFLMFKTGGSWGSAFLKGSTYLSGICDKAVGGYWKTLDVPKDATTLRYGYLYDEIAANVGYPAFEYLEFVGKDLTVQVPSGFMDRPATGCHAFSVKVNIAPAQGNPDGYAEATDYGYIQLPTNYDPYGDPTRLIIVCHGAGANLATYQSDAWKNTNYSFWTDLGYAVMDMYASPTELAGDDKGLHYGSPIVVDCYKEGYDYVMEHFNLKQDGVFLIGASMGGLSSFQIAQSGEFPVIAQVGYCPAIDLFKQAYVNPWTTASYQRSQIAKYFGFTGTAPAFTDSKYPSAAEIAFYKDNFAKTIPYSPILSNVVSGDLEKIFDVIPSSATAASPEEEALYQQLTATHPNPLMIFHNTDDSTVSYRYSQYFVDMVNRSGQEALLRTFTSGGHNAWVNGNSHTVQGINGNITIKDSQYEAYKFFEKFEKHEAHQPWVDPAVAPTCTATGLTQGSHCAICGEVLAKQEAVPAKDHSYTAVVTPPTCTEQGHTTYTCACGDSYVDDEVAATGHSWDNGSVTTQPTCTTDGERTFTCLNDSTHTSTETVAQTGHTEATAVRENEIAASCTKAGSYDDVVYCTGCQTELRRKTVSIPMAEHTPQVIPAVPPTYDAPGLTEGSRCSVCGTILKAQETVPVKEPVLHAELDAATGVLTVSGVLSDAEAISAPVFVAVYSAGGQLLTVKQPVDLAPSQVTVTLDNCFDVASVRIFRLDANYLPCAVSAFAAVSK